MNNKLINRILSLIVVVGGLSVLFLNFTNFSVAQTDDNVITATETINEQSAYADEEHIFSSLDKLKAAKLNLGDVVTTLSYYNGLNEGGGVYTIKEKTEETDEGKFVALENGLMAELQIDNDTIYASQYGLIGDGVTDNSDQCSRLLKNTNYKIEFEQGIYVFKQSMVVYGDVNIYGNGEVVFRFENRVPMAENATGGLFTINGGNIKMQNVQFEYIADLDTQFDNHVEGTDSSKGGQGVLLKIRSCSTAVIDSCVFSASGEQNPAICLLWLKAENGNIDNVEISNSHFSCMNSNMVGGDLWVQGIDGIGKTVNNLWVHDNVFIKNGNDEILGVVCESEKEDSMGNILIEDNEFTFVDGGTKNDVFITLGMVGCNNEFESLIFRDNRIHIEGEMKTIITANNESLPDNNGTIIIQNNTIEGETETDIICYQLRNANAEISDNTYSISSAGNRVVYVSYDDGGKLTFENETVTLSAEHVNYLASISSKWFDNACVDFVNCNFEIQETSMKNAVSNIQMPNSGILRFCKCSFDLSKSKGNKDIVFQMLLDEEKENQIAEIIIDQCISKATWRFWGEDKNRNNKIHITETTASAVEFTSQATDSFSFGKIEISGGNVKKVIYNGTAFELDNIPQIATETKVSDTN